jgi:hypothetical protein
MEGSSSKPEIWREASHPNRIILSQVTMSLRPKLTGGSPGRKKPNSRSKGRSFRAAPLMLIAGFLATICAVPLVQFCSELRQPRAGGRLAHVRYLQGAPRMEENPRRAQSRGSLESSSSQEGIEGRRERAGRPVDRFAMAPSPRPNRPHGRLGVGNEQACVGRDGWLFYRPDVEYITGPPFLTPGG